MYAGGDQHRINNPAVAGKAGISSTATIEVDMDAGTMSVLGTDGRVHEVSDAIDAADTDEWYFFAAFYGNSSTSLSSASVVRLPDYLTAATATAKGSLAVGGRGNTGGNTTTHVVLPSSCRVGEVMEAAGAPAGGAHQWVQYAVASATAADACSTLRVLPVHPSHTLGELRSRTDDATVDLRLRVNWQAAVGVHDAGSATTAAPATSAPATGMDTSGGGGDSGSDGAADSVHLYTQGPILQWLCEHGHLRTLVRRARQRLGDTASGTPLRRALQNRHAVVEAALAAATATSEDEALALAPADLWQFLRWLECASDVPGFAAAFSASQRTAGVALLLECVMGQDDGSGFAAAAASAADAAADAAAAAPSGASTPAMGRADGTYGALAPTGDAVEFPGATLLAPLEAAIRTGAVVPVPASGAAGAPAGGAAAAAASTSVAGAGAGAGAGADAGEAKQAADNEQGGIDDPLPAAPPAIVASAAATGTLDWLLLLLAEAQAIRPRNEDHVAGFQDPIVVEERARHKAQAAADAANRAAAGASGGGGTNGPWAAGTGYSSRDDDRAGNRQGAVAARLAARIRKRREDARQAITRRVLRLVRSMVAGSPLPAAEAVYAAADASALVPVLQSFLRSTELAITSAPQVHGCVACGRGCCHTGSPFAHAVPFVCPLLLVLALLLLSLVWGAGRRTT